MLSDTKIDVDLSGEIDQQDTIEQASPAMSLPVPLNLSQPLVKEWFAKKRANIRPLGTFFNTANFQVPPSAGRLTKRLYKNIEHFQSNYMLVFLVLVVYCLISSLSALFPSSSGPGPVGSSSGCWAPPCSSSLDMLPSTTMMLWMSPRTRNHWLERSWRRSEDWICIFIL